MILVVMVCFIMVMFLWLLANLGVGIPGGQATAAGWLPWFACLFLGIAVFLGVGWPVLR
jgi:uncharacterized membrane protein YadS